MKECPGCGTTSNAHSITCKEGMMDPNTFAPKTVREGAGLLKRLETELDKPVTSPQTRQSRFEWNGTDLFVDAILVNQKQAKQFIAAMTAIVPFLPTEDS